MRIAILLLAALSSSAFAADTHCSKDEQVLLSCQLAKSNKVVSLCASTDLAKDQGSLVYRFGKIGKPEFTFPENPKESLAAFTYSHYFRAQVDRTDISFKNKEVEYQVFDYYDGETKPEYQQGVRVLAADGTETTLLCDKKIDAHLENLRGVIACDTENPLFDCE